MKFYWLMIVTLAVWRVTHLLHVENGPWDSVKRIRDLFLKTSWRGVASCFHCLGLWVALPPTLWAGETWPEKLLLWLACAGGASLLELATTQAAPPPPYYEEDPLRKLDVPRPSLNEGDSNV